jgi:hypothetical protein
MLFKPECEFGNGRSGYSFVTEFVNKDRNMSIIGSTQFLERIQFFNGERLFASDLQALEAFNREMRWLHNQSLHQAGVGSGFQVVGNVGDRQVTISPGYAIDSCGREIILTENLTLPIPPVADNGSGGSVFYDLTVSYPDDTELKPSETRGGICMPAGVIRLREEPVFCWVLLSNDPSNHQPVDQRLKDRIQRGLFLVLAQVEIFNCRLKQPVSTVPRRNARPPRQPRIACGVQQTPGWQAVNIGTGTSTGSDVIVVPFGSFMYTGSVDTSSGAFQAVPSYTARLVGNRIFSFTDSTGAPQSFVMDALISIPADGTLTTKGFSLQIFPVAAGVTSTSIPAQSDITNAVNQWTVSWMGVEG